MAWKRYGCLFSVLLLQFPLRLHAQNIDVRLFKGLNQSYHAPFFDRSSRLVSDTEPYLVTGVSFGFLLWGCVDKSPAERETGILVGTAVLTGTGSAEGLKCLFHRQRPYDVGGIRILGPREKSYAFPSGHTTSAFAFATVLGHRYPKWRIPVYTYAGLVGLSRIYGGHHYPSDVLAGAVLGYAIGRVVVYFEEELLRFFGRHQEDYPRQIDLLIIEIKKP